MKSLLICPSVRHQLPALAEAMPLALVPVLGKTLVEYWLEHVASLGATRVRILTTQWQSAILAIVARGERWGIEVTVITEPVELTPTQARHRLRGDETDWLPEPHDVILMDHFPTLPEYPLLGSYQEWFAGSAAMFAHANSPDRIGMREVRRNLWVSLRAHVAEDAQFYPPCWIGEHAHIGRHCIVGPETIIERGALIEDACEIAHSIVGPETFIGTGSELRNSIALGNTLVNWKTNAATKVTDPFLLSSLREPVFQTENPELAPAGQLVMDRGTAPAIPFWRQLFGRPARIRIPVDQRQQQ